MVPDNHQEKLGKNYRCSHWPTIGGSTLRHTNKLSSFHFRPCLEACCRQMGIILTRPQILLCSFLRTPSWAMNCGCILLRLSQSLFFYQILAAFLDLLPDHSRCDADRDSIRQVSKLSLHKLVCCNTRPRLRKTVLMPSNWWAEWSTYFTLTFPGKPDTDERQICQRG